MRSSRRVDQGIQSSSGAGGRANYPVVAAPTIGWGGQLDAQQPNDILTPQVKKSWAPGSRKGRGILSEANPGIALVVGGSRGIGRAIALRLARSGCDIWLTYRSNHEQARETQRQIEAARP